ncbi:di-/tripeptide transporter [Mycolicibacterium conceptionense]|uniref:Di-/tripeptide transporter n=1 Tax=Mycolicibacterium conceptionense TaxID=451644 RepID=A0A0U1DMS3_9MYCO|nr:di-/tripeptide transporter [Mycolicibacterium conceptionense]
MVVLMPEVQDGLRHRGFFGHPIGLANLFGVELWERFSFYGMLTILGYYLYYTATDGGLGLPKSTATGIIGAYGGLVYLSTVLGGWIADRLLGMERTVFYGGVVVMAGHIALALVPGLAGVGCGLTLVASDPGRSRPMHPRCSAPSTTRTIRAQTAASPCSISESIWAPSSDL